MSASTLRRLLRRGGLLALLFLAFVPAEGQKEEPPPPRPPSKYRIVRVHLEAGRRGPQAAVSRGFYIVNFGSREGVQRGSIFNVYSRNSLMGLVRVDRVWRDSAAVSLVNLVHKAMPGSPNPLERGYYLEPKFVFLESILFDRGRPNIDPDMHERLRYAARFIRAYSDFPLIIEGHTDDTGDKKKNQVLSEERAGQIRDFLHEVHRLPIEQMHVRGYGQSDPIATNTSAEGQRLNRRVDIVLADRVPE
jgi:outer membrane protein OmpA-like peptidoglycan-associated protein